VTPLLLGNVSSVSDGGASGNNGLSGSLVDQQQAALLQEQVLTEALANRRRLFDEYLYEREKTPTAEQQRQRSQQEQLEPQPEQPLW
jgi:hypothetical protein